MSVKKKNRYRTIFDPNAGQPLGVMHTDWCHNRDLNPDAIWQQILNLPRLPVPTLWHKSPAEAGQVLIPRG